MAIVAFFDNLSSYHSLGVRGAQVGVEEALSDIENRKRAEDALKKSEAYLAHAQQLTKAKLGI